MKPFVVTAIVVFTVALFGVLLTLVLLELSALAATCDNAPKGATSPGGEVSQIRRSVLLAVALSAACSGGEPATDIDADGTRPGRAPSSPVMGMELDGGASSSDTAAAERPPTQTSGDAAPAAAADRIPLGFDGMQPPDTSGSSSSADAAPPKLDAPGTWDPVWLDASKSRSRFPFCDQSMPGVGTSCPSGARSRNGYYCRICPTLTPASQPVPCFHNEGVGACPPVICVRSCDECTDRGPSCSTGGAP